MIFSRFKVLILGEATEACLESVRKQNFNHFDVCIAQRVHVHEGPSLSLGSAGCKDLSLKEERIALAMGDDCKLGDLRPPPLGGRYTREHVPQRITLFNPAEDDICLILSGSDELYNSNVFSQIHDAYLRYDIVFTYSQYLSWKEGRVGSNRLPSPKLIASRAYRKKGWPCGGLFTFKGSLYHKLRPQDILEEAPRASLVYPMLEMAGPRFQFIPEVHLLVNTPLAAPPKKLLKKPKYAML